MEVKKSPDSRFTTYSVPDAVVQRAMAMPRPAPVKPVEVSSVSVVQRAPGDGQQGTDALQPPEVDLDALARQVYPVLKRMLQVERERSGHR